MSLEAGNIISGDAGMIAKKVEREFNYHHVLTWFLNGVGVRKLNNQQPKELITEDCSKDQRKDPTFRLKICINSANKVEVHLLSTIRLRYGIFYKVRINATEIFTTEWKFLATATPSQWLLLADDFPPNDFFYYISISVDVPKVDPAHQIGSDFGRLLDSKIFADVTIKSAEGVEYPAHKAILSGRSSVLRAHFEPNTKEGQTNTVESAFDSDTLENILTYIYSDKVPKINDIPEKILAAADFYQLNGLKCLCEHAFQGKITIDNAVEILQLADLYSLEDLKQETLKFITTNVKAIVKTESWHQLDCSNLFRDIITNMVNNITD